MHKRTWRKYNQDLVKRGGLTFFIDKNDLSQPIKKRKVRGRPKLFSHPLIQLLLMLKIQYRLTYRTLEGFAKSMLPLIQKDIALPTYSLVCKRASELEAKLPKLSTRRPQSSYSTQQESKSLMKESGKSKSMRKPRKEHG